jgi:LacI family transcriptional regulator
MPSHSAVSIRDVAERAGVALGTVSNVLNRPERVAETTRLRVLQAIADLGFVRNDAARQLRAGKSRTLGLVVLDVRNPFFTDVGRGAEERAAAAGLSVLLGNSDNLEERESTHLALFEEQRVKGLLISPLGDLYGRLERLRERGTPTVLVDHRADGHSFSSVSVDDVAGGYLAVSHLIEQGCTRLAYVAGLLNTQQVSDRLQGATDAVAEHPRVQLEVMSSPGLSVETGRKLGAAVVERPPQARPDGIFAANDLVAVGLLQSFGRLDGVRVPHDIALVGYDDIDFATATVVPLSSVRQPSTLIGRTAVDLLLREVAAAEAGLEFEHEQVVFQPELVVRESSQRSPAGQGLQSPHEPT